MATNIKQGLTLPGIRKSTPQLSGRWLVIYKRGVCGLNGKLGIEFVEDMSIVAGDCCLGLI
jgi:hypothetical protein